MTELNLANYLFENPFYCHVRSHETYVTCSFFLVQKLLTCNTEYAETEQGVAQAIIRSVIDFKRAPWPNVSDSAKDLVKKMLDPDPSRRLTAEEVLGNARFKYILILVSSLKMWYNGIMYDSINILYLLMQSILGYKMEIRH